MTVSVHCHLNNLATSVEGIILIALNEVGKLAHCGWRHSLGWDPGLSSVQSLLLSAYHSNRKETRLEVWQRKREQERVGDMVGGAVTGPRSSTRQRRIMTTQQSAYGLLRMDMVTIPP